MSFAILNSSGRLALLAFITALNLATAAIAADALTQHYNNARTGADWPSHGLDYAETRFSPLKEVNADTVKQLGPVWSYNLESTRGVESTPVVVDGIMYVTASWSVVHAVSSSRRA